MEHGGKMEHRVFWKKPVWCRSIFKSIWFLSSASSASHVEIKLAIDHVLSISQKRNLTLLINQFTLVLTSIALTNQLVDPLYVVKYNHVPLVLIFIAFDGATGDIIVHIMAFPKRNLGGKTEHGTFTEHFILPQRCFILPQCPGPLYPPSSFHENFSAESD